MPRSGGGENVEKSKDERSKLKVTARQRSIDFSPYGRRPSVHIQLLATLIENLFLMFSLRYGQDDKYRENSSSTPGGEEHENVTASNALFIKNRPPYFFIITDFIIFITDNTLLYCKPLVGDFAAKIVIPTERSDETLVRQCL